MKISDLFFGIRRMDFNTNSLVIENLFQSLRVQHSIAVWAANPELHDQYDLISFCFGDTRGRVEYEFLARPMIVKKPEDPANWHKVDTYKMYVEPNADYLRSLVEQIDKKEGKRWLEANKI